MKKWPAYLLFALLVSLLQPAQADTSRLDEVLAAGKLRVCTTGDYKPFSYLRPDGQFEGIDIDLARVLAHDLNVELEFVKTTWSALMGDFLSKCDIAMGGISITLERQKKVAFTVAHMLDGKSAIVRCADTGKFTSLASIDQATTRAIVNPGGTNERYARAHFKQAQLTVHEDNVTIFEQIVQGKADVMVTDTSETLWQARQHPELCPILGDKPLQFAEKAYMLPRGDVTWKAWVDSWMHLQKETGGYQRVVDKWLK
jgi:cyclohexadienyl dehydratase